MKHAFTRFAATAALLVLAAATQAATDFSGTWQLNTDKGKNLGMVAAVKETIVIRQSADKYVAEHASTFMMKTEKRTVTYDLTGKPVPNEGAMGDKAETVAKWDGGKLVVTWSAEGAVPGTKSVKTETRSLSADGKTMTVVNARPNKEPMEMVYEKQ